MNIIEVNMNDEAFTCGDRYCMTERNEVYYLAFENNLVNPISVFWSDLKFIRKGFGVDRIKGQSSEDSVFTKESVNYSRKIAIANMKQAIKLKCLVRDLEYLNENGTWKMVDGFITDEYSNKKAGKVHYTPTTLTKSTRSWYEADIAKGLYVVCKAVEMGQKDFVI